MQQPVYYSDVLIYGDCYTSLDTTVVAVAGLVNSREAPPLAKNESISTMATGSILNDHRRIIDIFNPPTKETIKAILLEESKLLGVSTTNSSTSSSSSNHQATNTTTDSSKQKQKEDILDQIFGGQKSQILPKWLLLKEMAYFISKRV